jgi:hypothetical protein
MDGYDPAGGNMPTMRLVDTTTREATSSRVAGTTYAVKVVPGTYDVWFDYVGLPSFRAAKDVAIAADTTIDVAADRAFFSLYLSRDGAMLPTSEWPAYTFLAATGTGERIATPTQFAKAWVGQFDVFVSDDAEDVPGLPVLAAAALTKGKQFGTQPITFSVITGTISLDGQPAAGRLRFVEKATGAKFFASANAQGAYRVRVTPGTYDVAFDPASPAVASGYFDVAAAVPMLTDGARALALATQPITLTATYDGQPTGGTLVLRDAAGALHTADVASGFATTRVGAGAYDAYLDRQAWDAELRVRIQTGVVGGASLSAAIAPVTATPSIAGADGWYLTQVRRATGEHFWTPFGAPSKVMPGAWDTFVSYEAHAAIATPPWNPYGTLGVPGPSVVVVPGLGLDLTPTLRDVTGTFTIGGAPGVGDLAIDLVARASGLVYRTSSSVTAGTFATRAAPGLYDVFASPREAGPRVKVATCVKID